MTHKQFLLTMLIFFILQPAYAGLPSNEKLQALKQKVDAKLAQYFKVKNGGGKCLQVIRSQINQNGGVVQVSSCSTGANQKWIYDKGMIKSASGKCLQAKGNPQAIGSHVEIADCNGSAKQIWGYQNQQLITSANTCLEVKQADVNKNGGIVQIANCIAKARHQQWAP